MFGERRLTSSTTLHVHQTTISLSGSQSQKIARTKKQTEKINRTVKLCKPATNDLILS